MKFFHLIMFSVLIFWACENNTPASDNVNGDTPVEKPQPTKSNSKWLCIPDKQVGLIGADADEESIIEAYGKENVTRQEVGIGEGETVAASIVFPGTPNELIVEWHEGLEYKKLFRIRIEGEGAKWETEEGIKVGTTLDELIKINGKDFNFYGFEWDYGGVTNDWDGGKINSKLTVVLTPGNPGAVYPELSGDGVFSSANTKAKEAQLAVSSIVIYFGL